MVSKIAEALSGVIKKFLSPALGSIICKQITKATKDEGPKVLHNVSAFVRTWLASKPTTPTVPPALPEPQTDFANLGFNPAVTMIQKVLGVLTNPTSRFYINKLTRELVNHNGSFTIKSGDGGLLPLHRSIDMAGAGIMDITLEVLTIGGLD